MLNFNQVLTKLGAAELLVSAEKLNKNAQRQIGKSGKKHKNKKKLYEAVSKPVKHKHSWIATATFTYQGDKTKHTHPLRFSGEHAPKLHVTGHKLKVTEQRDGKPFSYFWGQMQSKPLEEKSGSKEPVKEDESKPATKEEAPDVKPQAPAAPAVESKFAKAGKLLKHGLGHAFETVADPFKKAWKLTRSSDYRKEVKEFVSKAVKTEAGETKNMASTFKKMVTGQAVSKDERAAAFNQVADLVKVALIGGFYGHVGATEGIAALAGIVASPIEEITGFLLDGPMRKVTKKLLGHEHGILPSAFYNKASARVIRAEGSDTDLVLQVVDAILDQVSKEDLSDDDVAEALARGGLKAEDKDKVAAALSGAKMTGKTMKINEAVAFAVHRLLEEDPRKLSGAVALESKAIINLVKADADIQHLVLVAAGAKIPAKSSMLKRGMRKLGKVAHKAGGKARKLVKKATSNLKKRAKKLVKKATAKPKKKTMTAAQRLAKSRKKPAKKKVHASADTLKIVKALLTAADVLDQPNT